MINFHKIAALSLALAASSMAATINPYTDLGSFNTAISGYNETQTENFNGLTSVFYNFSLSGGVQGPNARGFTGPGTISPYTPAGVFFDQVDQDPLQTTLIDRVDGFDMYAAGALWDVSLYGVGSNLVITLNLSGGGTQVLTQVLGGNVGNYDAPFFFGFTSDEAFSSFTISAGGTVVETYSLDSLITASLDEDPGDPGDPDPPPPSDIPEPSTFGLMGIALVGLGVLRRKRS